MGRSPLFRHSRQSVGENRKNWSGCSIPSAATGRPLVFHRRTSGSCRRFPLRTIASGRPVTPLPTSPPGSTVRRRGGRNRRLFTPVNLDSPEEIRTGRGRQLVCRRRGRRGRGFERSSRGMAPSLGAGMAAGFAGAAAPTSSSPRSPGEAAAPPTTEPVSLARLVGGPSERGARKAGTAAGDGRRRAQAAETTGDLPGAAAPRRGCRSHSLAAASLASGRRE
jgi:hypothetical protein